MARHPGKSRCCSPAQPAELFARSGPRSRLIVLATNVATGGTGKCRRQALTDQVRSWELKGELDVEPEIEGVLGADPGIKGIFGGDLEIAGVLVGKYGRTAVGSGAFPLWQSVRVRVAMMPPPLTRFLFARWGKNCQRLQPLVHAMPHWRRPANEITEPSFSQSW